MSLLKDIKQRIASIVTAAGYTLDRGSDMSDDTDKRVSLHSYPGFASQLGFGHQGVEVEFPHFQVVVRGEPTDYDGPEAVIQSIYLDLPKVQGTTLAPSNEVYRTIIPKQPPFFLRRDEKRRVYFAVNFMVEKEPA